MKLSCITHITKDDENIMASLKIIPILQNYAANIRFIFLLTINVNIVYSASLNTIKHSIN